MAAATPRPVLQPIVDLATGAVRGYEALSRFDGAQPRAVFDEAARDGSLAALEAAALRASLACRADVPASCFLAVNVEPRSLAAPEVRAVLDGATDLRGVVVELTGSSWPAEAEPVLAALARLRGAGARIAVDDAGRDDAGLQRIARVRPEFLKVDRTLVHGIDRNAGNAAVVETLRALADRLGAQVIAEGVEHEAELETLVALRVPLAQGHLLGRPGASADAELAAEIAERHEGDPSTLAAILEPAPTVLDGDVLGRRAAFATSPGSRYVVCLDEHGAAVAIVPRDGEEIRDAVLRAQVTESLASVAGRALAAGTGTTPILCHDALGRYAGIVRVERLVTELVRGLEERAGDAERGSVQDPLTGALNRRGWDRSAERESARVAHFGRPSAVISIRLDPAAGLLRRAAEVARAHARPFDVLARVGAGELGLIVVECGEDEARRVAGELSDALRDARVPASLGWAVCAPGGPDVAAAWAAAAAGQSVH